MSAGFPIMSPTAVMRTSVNGGARKSTYEMTLSDTPTRAREREPSNFELDGARADAATSAKATASRLAHDDTASQRPDGVGQLPRGLCTKDVAQASPTFGKFCFVRAATPDMLNRLRHDATVAEGTYRCT